MSRYIDADALIADMRERYCKPCQERKEDYNGVKCRACWVDDAMDDVDGFGDNAIDIVRCKDCKSWRSDGGALMLCEISQSLTLEDDYCSFGERSKQ